MAQQTNDFHQKNNVNVVLFSNDTVTLIAVRKPTG